MLAHQLLLPLILPLIMPSGLESKAYFIHILTFLKPSFITQPRSAVNMAVFPISQTAIIKLMVYLG